MATLDYTITYTGTSALESFYLEITNDGLVTVDNFGAEDSVVLYDTEYDFEYLYAFAYAERNLGPDYDLELTTDDEGDEQILIYTNSADEDEVASYDDLFAVLNITDDVTLTGTDDADTFEFTATADDGVVTVNDFGAEDTVVIGDSEYSADFLVAFAYAERNFGGTTRAELTIDDDGNGEIALYADSSDTDIAVYDELYAVSFKYWL